MTYRCCKAWRTCLATEPIGICHTEWSGVGAGKRVIGWRAGRSYACYNFSVPNSLMCKWFLFKSTFGSDPMCRLPKRRARVAPSLVGNKLTFASRLARTFRPSKFPGECFRPQFSGRYQETAVKRLGLTSSYRATSKLSSILEFVVLGLELSIMEGSSSFRRHLSQCPKNLLTNGIACLICRAQYFSI